MSLENRIEELTKKVDRLASAGFAIADAITYSGEKTVNVGVDTDIVSPMADEIEKEKEVVKKKMGIDQPAECVPEVESEVKKRTPRKSKVAEVVSQPVDARDISTDEFLSFCSAAFTKLRTNKPKFKAFTDIFGGKLDINAVESKDYGVFMDRIEEVIDSE